MIHIYTAPSGVEVNSCKPEPHYQGQVEHLFWSWNGWGSKIVRTLVTIALHLPGLD